LLRPCEADQPHVQGLNAMQLAFPSSADDDHDAAWLRKYRPRRSTSLININEQTLDHRDGPFDRCLDKPCEQLPAPVYRQPFE
jgi:hypothetical protein